jgi:SAM-dependent methyltransferase
MNWKGWAVEIGLNGLPLLSSILTLLLLRRAGCAPLADRLGTPSLATAWLLSRGAYALFLYAILGWHGVPDFQIWVARHAEPVLEGGLAGRDFRNAYGPLFPYLQAGGVAVAGHRLGVLLPFLLGDLLVVGGTARLARDLGGDGAGRWVRAWLVASPLLWHQAVVNGQDEPLFAGILVAGVLLLHLGRDALGGVVLGLGFAATKSTFGYYAAAVALALLPDVRRFARCALAGGAAAGLVIGAFAAAGATSYQYTTDRHIQEHGHWGTSLLDTARNVGWLHATTHRRLLPFVATALFAALAVLALRGRPGPYLPRAVALAAGAHALFALLLPGALVEYVVQGLPFLLLLSLLGGGAYARFAPPALAVGGVLVAWHYGAADWAWPLVNTTLRLLFLALYAATLVQALRAPAAAAAGTPAETAGEGLTGGSAGASGAAPRDCGRLPRPMSDPSENGTGVLVPPPDYYDAHDAENRCLLCGDPDYTLLHDVRTYAFPFRFQRCSCGLIKQTPMPNERFFEWFFNSDVFFSAKATKAGRIWGFYDYFADEDCRLETSRRRFARLRPHMPAGKLRILKIGPSTGTFLHVAAQEGHEVLGVDVSSRFVEFARTTYGVRIDHGRFERMGYPDASFDCIVLFNVVENIPNLDEFLREVHRVLRPGGVFLLNHVDMDGNLLARLQGPRYFLWRPPICYAFGGAAARRLLASHGFEPGVEIRDRRILHLEKVATLLHWRWLLVAAKFLRIHRVKFEAWAYPSRIVVARRSGAS